MKRLIKLTLFMFIIVIVTGCSTTNSKYLKEISYDKYHELLDNKETFILEIMRTDCSACIEFKPKLKELTNKYKIEVKFINTDHLTEKEKDNLFDETGIEGTPTIIFYEEGYEETVASRIVGNVSLEKAIKKFKSNGYIKE